RLAEAREAVHAALAIRKKLADAHPAVTQFQTNLARSHLDFGRWLELEGKPAEALAEYRRALAIRRKLAEAHPDVTDFQLFLAYDHETIGDMLCREGKLAEGLPQCEVAREPLGQLPLAAEHV